MANWVYLKKSYCGYDDLKAAALASVLFMTNEEYNIVHTDVVSIYLKGLKNVIIGIPNKNDGDTISILDLPDYAPFQILCNKISVALSIKREKHYCPYLGFVRKENEIDRQMSNKGNLILLSFYSNDRDLSLISKLEEVVFSLKGQPYNAICCGSKRETMIKGAYDFRELIQIDEIIKNRDRIKVIITALPLVKEIARLLDIPVVYLFSDSFVAYFGKSVIVESGLTNYSQKLTELILDICNNNMRVDKPLTQHYVKKKFEVPYSFDEDIIPYYTHYSSYINFLFLPPYYEDSINTRTCLQSKIKGFSYMPQTREEYEYHLNLIKESGLRFIVLWQDKECIISKEILEYYTKLGACGFIIAKEENARIIKDYDSNLLVLASIVQRLCKGISTKDFEYYDYCVLYFPFNRSLDAIKQLSELKNKLVVMPNSFCHTDCPGVQHWFAKDMNSFEFEKLCPAYKDNSKSTFIYPEHLYLFDDYVGGYKLQGREWSTDYVVTVCESYFNRFTSEALLPAGVNEVLQDIHKKFSLEEYYNFKTNEIVDLI